MKIKTILLPVDFSSYDVVALDYAAGLARQFGATIHVVHVVEPLSAYGGMAYWGEAMEDEKQRFVRLHALQSPAAGVALQHVMLRAQTTGLTAQADIANELVQYAAQQGCDLIVMSSHGRSGVLEQLFGGVTQHVLREARCPVLAVKSQRPSSTTSKPM